MTNGKAQRWIARSGSGLTTKTAALIADEILAMKAARQAVTGKRLVQRASNPSHPLHALFEWDDAKAGAAHRLEQANRYLGAILVLDVRTKLPSRAVYSVTHDEPDASERGRSYEWREKVLGTVPMREQVEVQLFDRMESAMREAVACDFAAHDKAWRKLGEAMKTHVPLAVRKARQKRDE